MSFQTEPPNPILCNKCGSEMRKFDVSEDGNQHYLGTYGLRAEFSTGYCSDPLPDGYSYRFDLCEPCLDELFKTFATPPDTKWYGMFPWPF